MGGMVEEIEKMVREKKKCYQSWLATKDQENRKIYTRMSREVKKAMSGSKTEVWERSHDRTDMCIGGNQTRAENHKKLAIRNLE